MRYATGTLLDEVAYIAAVFGWSLDTVLDLEHPDRRHFLAVAQQLSGAVADDEPAEYPGSAEVHDRAEGSTSGRWPGG